MVELLLVLSIVVILAMALGFFYQGWMGRYKVESAVKQLYADLMYARTMAMQTNSDYFIDFDFPTQTTYRMSIDDSNGVAKVAGGDGTFQPQANPAVPTAATDTTQPTFPKTVAYTINNGVLLTFDKRGLIYSGNPPVLIDPLNPPVVINPPVTINLTYANTGDTPDYDCIVISQSRINIGLMAGVVCNAK